MERNPAHGLFLGASGSNNVRRLASRGAELPAGISRGLAKPDKRLWNEYTISEDCSDEASRQKRLLGALKSHEKSTISSLDTNRKSDHEEPKSQPTDKPLKFAWPERPKTIIIDKTGLSLSDATSSYGSDPEFEELVEPPFLASPSDEYRPPSRSRARPPRRHQNRPAQPYVEYDKNPLTRDPRDEKDGNEISAKKTSLPKHTSVHSFSINNDMEAEENNKTSKPHGQFPHLQGSF